MYYHNYQVWAVTADPTDSDSVWASAVGYPLCFVPSEGHDWIQLKQNLLTETNQSKTCIINMMSFLTQLEWSDLCCLGDQLWDESVYRSTGPGTVTPTAQLGLLPGCWGSALAWFGPLPAALDSSVLQNPSPTFSIHWSTEYWQPQ